MPLRSQAAYFSSSLIVRADYCGTGLKQGYTPAGAATCTQGAWVVKDKAGEQPLQLLLILTKRACAFFPCRQHGGTPGRFHQGHAGQRAGAASAHAQTGKEGVFEAVSGVAMLFAGRDVASFDFSFSASPQYTVTRRVFANDEKGNLVSEGSVRRALLRAIILVFVCWTRRVRVPVPAGVV